VGIGQSDLKIVAVVAVRVSAERGRVPDVVLAVVHLGPADLRTTGTPDTEVHLRRVVPYRRRHLAGLEHAQHDPYAGGKPVARRTRGRMEDHRFASPVGGARKRGEPLDLGIDLFARYDDRLPEIERARRSRAADVAKNGLGHAADSCLEAVEIRGTANPGSGMMWPMPDASARRTISVPSATSVFPGRGLPAATITEIGCTHVQSPPHLPSYQSINSALS